jgi:hypothetical protein
LGDILADPQASRRNERILAFCAKTPASKIMAVLRDLEQKAAGFDLEAKLASHVLLTRLAQADPAAAQAMLERLDARKDSEKAISLLAAWASVSPQAAAAWLGKADNRLVDYPLLGPVLAGAIAKEWVRQDTTAALQWLGGLGEPLRTGAYIGGFGTLAAGDAPRAYQLLLELPPDQARQQALRDVFSQWAKSHPEQAAARAREDQQLEALEAVFSVWAAEEAAAASGFLQKLPAASRGRYLPAIAESWAATEPQAALEWMLQQPPHSSQEAAAGRVLWNWTTQAPWAASAWLARQPASAAKDSAVCGLALAALDSQPASALAWAQSISNPERRKLAVGIGLAAWKLKDKPAADAWAEQNLP